MLSQAYGQGIGETIAMGPGLWTMCWTDQAAVYLVHMDTDTVSLYFGRPLWLQGARQARIQRHCF